MHGRVRSSVEDERGELSIGSRMLVLDSIRLAKCARTPKSRARKAAKKRARVEPEHVVELPRLDELPQDDDDDEGVISD